MKRVSPKVVVKHLSGNCYHPRGATPRLIVIHDTEGHNVKGVADLAGLGEVFAHGVPPRSCHVATDAEGQSGRYVHDGDAAWQDVSYNRASLGIEQIGMASQSFWPHEQVKETARWVAHWSYVHHIPIRRARTLAGRVLLSGVATHSSLGAAGGGHTDPGPHYPLAQMMELARRYRKELAK